MDDLDRIRRDVRKTLNLDPDKGVLGIQNGASRGQIYVPYKIGYVWVCQRQASGFGTEKAVRVGPNVNLPMKPGTGVRLGYVDGERCVLSVDFDALVTSGGNPLSTNPLDPSAQFSRQSDIVTALCTPDNPDTTLYVLARGWWFLYNRTWYRFGGERVNLTSFVPSAGQHRVIGIFVLADGSATEAKGSTAQSMLAPLDKSDVQEATDAATDGSTPLWFWTLYGGQTAIKASDTFIDGRNMLNVGLGLDTAADRVRFTQTATVTVANSSAETTLLGAGVGSLTLAANALTAGRTLRITASGVIGSDAILAGNITVKFKLGSTIIVSTGTLALTSALSAQLWQLDLLVTCRTTGGSGTVMAQGAMRITVAAADTVWPLTNGTSTVTVDTTVSNAMDVTVTFSIADGDNTISATNVAIESLN